MSTSSIAASPRMYMNWAVVGAVILSLLGWFFEHGQRPRSTGSLIPPPSSLQSELGCAGAHLTWGVVGVRQQ